jgi:hypothetical protein
MIRTASGRGQEQRKEKQSTTLFDGEDRETDHVTTYLHYKLPTCVFTAYKENKGR